MPKGLLFRCCLAGLDLWSGFAIMESSAVEGIWELAGERSCTSDREDDECCQV